MQRYKVALATRFTDQQLTNGDVVQMLKTKKYLEVRHGLHVVVVRSPEEAERCDADIIHVFSMPRIDDTIGFFAAARKTGKKVALSSVYWDLSHAAFINALYPRGLFAAARWLRPLRRVSYTLYNGAKSVVGSTSQAIYSRQWFETRRRVLIEAGVILPNSEEELELLARDFRIPLRDLQAKTVVVPNAVDLEVVGKAGGDAVPDLDQFVLCVASLDPVKNQLGLVRALADDPDTWIVLRGSVRNAAYAKELERVAQQRGRVRFLGELPDEAVAMLYRKARVHVLASFRESTGLASLEALASGCEIVVADAPFCPIRWYQFDRYGHVCDPYSESSIRHAVRSSFRDRRNSVGDAYRRDYSYERAVDLTKEGYDRLLCTG